MLHLHRGPRLKGATQGSSGPTSVFLLATKLSGIIRTVFGALVHLCSAYFLYVLPHQLLPMESNRRRASAIGRPRGHLVTRHCLRARQRPREVNGYKWSAQGAPIGPVGRTACARPSHKGGSPVGYPNAHALPPEAASRERAQCPDPAGLTRTKSARAPPRLCCRVYVLHVLPQDSAEHVTLMLYTARHQPRL